MNKLLIFVLFFSISVIPIHQSFSQLGPLDEMTSEEAEWLQNEMERLSNQPQIPYYINGFTLILIISGGVAAVIGIFLIKRKKK